MLMLISWNANIPSFGEVLSGMEVVDKLGKRKPG
jgi:cyclophilin family peptidyl-prolyl cis-trans isomerase